jgi:hypothetical protein
MASPMPADRIAELRRISTGEDWSPPQREDVAELLDEIARLRSIHGHDFTNVYKAPVTCVCGVTVMDWLENRGDGRDESIQWRDAGTLDEIDKGRRHG